MTDPSSVTIVVVTAVLLVLSGATWLVRLRNQRRYGHLVSSDLAGQPGPILRSERYRLIGRPDELRRLADGRFVPVELKSGRAPLTRPPWSHRVQVAAYCLLVEETSGRPPPYGLVRYRDGVEFEVPWNRSTWDDLLELREELNHPYDGSARPSPGRCAGCVWRLGCDRAFRSA